MSPTANATVSFTVRNSGSVAGAEVAQLYVAGGLPGDPPRALKGFQYTGLLAPGEVARVSLSLSARELCVWSVEAHAFVGYAQGEYAIAVGASSRDVRLAGSVRVG